MSHTCPMFEMTGTWADDIAYMGFAVAALAGMLLWDRLKRRDRP